MKMIWKLPWWFYVEERILRKTKKSGVLTPVVSGSKKYGQDDLENDDMKLAWFAA